MIYSFLQLFNRLLGLLMYCMCPLRPHWN